MAKLLLVEPDKLLADIYAKGLMADKHGVTAVATAQAAITAADRRTPDLVILELQLVEHSGIEFLYEFRSYAEWQTVPLIIHSQVPPAEFADSSELLRCELGVQTYLYKPRTPLRELLSAVRDQLSVAA